MSIAKWIPDRKVLAGGIAGVLAFFGSQAAGFDPETSTAIAGSILMLVEYFLPASVSDIINKIDGVIKKAGIDPKTPVGDLTKK